MTEINICNAALSLLGVRATFISSTTNDLISEAANQSREAQACATLYDGCVNQTLADGLWPFATKFHTLTGSAAGPAPWAYSYAKPPGLISPLEIVDTARLRYTMEQVKFDLYNDAGTVKIVTDQANAVLKCIVNGITYGSAGGGSALTTSARAAAVDLYPPSFCAAVAYRLAAKVAPFVGAPPQIQTFCAKLYQYQIRVAQSHALNSRLFHDPPSAEWHDARNR